MPKRLPPDAATVNGERVAQLALEFNLPLPSFDSQVPATVRYNENIPAAAKLLYSEIRALTSVRGYCWAPNAYFERLYNVDRSTVQRWISALAKEKLIRVEMRFTTQQRHIFVLDREPQKRGGTAAKTPPTRRKNAANITTENNEIIKSETLNVAAAPSPTATQPTAPAEGKGQATPAAIEQLAALCQADPTSERRFRQLLTICQDADCLDQWDAAFAGMDKGINAGTIANPGAWFGTTLAKLLLAQNVYVPVSTPSKRKTVRAAIRDSLAEADNTKRP